MPTLYGIRNCDTVKKARTWLDGHGVAHRFHDLRADGLDAAMLDAWIAAVGHETLLNTRGTTWRQLPEAEREGVDGGKAAALMLAHPTLVKRPVLDHHGRITVGFKAEIYAGMFGD